MRVGHTTELGRWQIDPQFKSKQLVARSHVRQCERRLPRTPSHRLTFNTSVYIGKEKIYVNTGEIIVVKEVRL